MTGTRAMQVTTNGETDVVVTRVFDASRALVFDCFTRPELVPRWLLGPPGWTMPVCEIDLRVGGRYHYVWRNPERGDMGVSGTYRELAPPERIVHTELFDEDWSKGGAVVTTVFTEADGKTMVTMTIRFTSAEAREAALATGMTRGMAQSYDRLDEVLAGEQGESAA